MRMIAGWVVLVLFAGIAGCSDGQHAASGGRLSVEGAFYPLVFLAERVGGPEVSVDNLTPAGAEPHDLELKTSQVAALERANVVVYLKGLQPAVDAAVHPGSALDLAAVEPLAKPDSALTAEDPASGTDPHVWLDPVRMQKLVVAVRDRFASLRPAARAGFTQRADALLAELRRLDAEFRTGLRTCRQRVFVTSHAAFGYLARRYGLRQLGILGVSPEIEPSPRRIAEIARFVEANHVTTIFFESLVSPKLAETVAREAHAHTAVLDPIEGLVGGVASGAGDYFSVMRRNLAALQSALGCT